MTSPGADIELLSILTDIYDAAVDSGRWRVVTRRLAAMFAGGVALFAQDGGGALPVILAATGFDSGFADSPVGICAGLVAWAAGMVAQSGRAAAPVPDGWCAGWLPPDGRHHGTVAVVAEEPAMRLAIVRPKCRGPMREAELARFGVLVPHLRRGIGVYRQSRAAGAGIAVALAGFERFQAAALLVDGRGCIRLANRSAQRLLGEGVVLDPRAGVLTALDRASDVLLRAAIGAGSGMVALPRRAGRPLMALVTRGDGNTAAGPAVLVLIRDCERMPLVDAQMLRVALGLTRAEANIVAWIAGGATPSEIAAARGIGLETIRSHLKRSMAKTGAARQVELVSLALRTAGFSPG
jgi:DNA-binding CsgD family transcriptional regulator